MSLPLYIFTLALDTGPFLPMQLATFNRLSVPWKWIIVEGAAANVNCTSWCQPQEPRFSRDGSHEFILSLRDHPRVRTIGKQWWAGGKVEMTNAALATIQEKCVLMQVDADELWTPEQLECMGVLFETYSYAHQARFFCRYFLGPNIVATGEDCYGANKGEWLRAFRFIPGMRFSKHEPPVLEDLEGKPGLDRNDTRSIGLIFDHWAYYFEWQVRYKENFYGYKDAVAHWRRLQQNKEWPVRNLKSFLPWVDDKAQADLLFR